MFRVKLVDSRFHDNVIIQEIDEFISSIPKEQIAYDLRAEQTQSMLQVFRLLHKLFKDRFKEEQVVNEIYQFKAGIGIDPHYHVFHLSAGKKLTQHNVAYLKPSKATSFNYLFKDKSITLFFSPKLYPSDNRTYIFTPPSMSIRNIVHGNVLFKQIWAKRKVNDTKAIWLMRPDDIKFTIKTLVDQLYVDVCTFRGTPARELKAHQYAYITENILKRALQLFSYIHVYNNVEAKDIKLVRLDSHLRAEYFDVTYNAFNRDGGALAFAECLLQYIGIWLEYMFVENYGHLVTTLRKV